MPGEPENEAALIRMAKTGCTEAFGVLVNRYEQRIYRLVYAITNNAKDAEDVLQETFLKAYAKVEQFRGDSQFYTWLVSIAINKGLTTLRGHHAPAWVSIDQSSDLEEAASAPRDIKDWRQNPEESYSSAELRAILSTALGDLEAPLRVIFALRDMEGFSSEETAKVLGLSVAALKTCLMQARLKLRKRLSVWFENPSALATR